jgi:hypothetical protein
MFFRNALLAAVSFAALGVTGCDRDDRAQGATPAPLAMAVSQHDEHETLAARVAAQWHGEAPVLAIYKTPTCGCCGAWVDHVVQAGFGVEVLDLPDLSRVKAQAGVPNDLVSCHTTVADGYFIEGHVPADVIARMLEERPDIAGIAVPGMPMGSPGMEGPYRDPYDVIAVAKDGTRFVYASRE